jgi:hypothetical protein
LTKKQKDWEAGKPAKKQNIGDAKKYPKYHSDPVAAAALKEAASYYNETGKYVTLKVGKRWQQSSYSWSIHLN